MAALLEKLIVARGKLIGWNPAVRRFSSRPRGSTARPGLTWPRPTGSESAGAALMLWHEQGSPFHERR